ncbi:hypothetical protein FAI40_08755 [Acetobacteraceae bacterium]|nr:hypothetical protein FAI40_08755 [Acetobacteraceae bacterium]
MRKGKYIGFGLLGLSLLGLWVEGGRLVSPERLWDGLRASLTKSTGLEWHAGHVEMTLFPRPAIEIDHLEGGIPGSIPLLNAEKTYAKLSVMTLLGHGMNIHSLSFDHAVIAYDGHPLHIKAVVKDKMPSEEESVSTGQDQQNAQSLISSSVFKNSKVMIGKIDLHESLIKWKNAVVRPEDGPLSGQVYIRDLQLNNISSDHPSFSMRVSSEPGKREVWGVEGHSAAFSALPDLLSAHVEPGKSPPWPFAIKFTFPQKEAKIGAKEDYLSLEGSIPFLGDGGQSNLLLSADLQSLQELQLISPSLDLPAVTGISGQANFHFIRADDRPQISLSWADLGIAHSKISLLAEMADRLSQDAGEAVRKTASSSVLKNVRLSNMKFRLDEGQPSVSIDSETVGRGGSWQLHLGLPSGLFSTIPLKSENLYELSVKPGSMKTVSSHEGQGGDKEIPAGFHLSGTVSPTDISGSLSGVAPSLPVVPLGSGWSLADDVGRELSILHAVSMSGEFHFTHSSENQKWKAFVHNGSLSSDELSFQADLEAGPETGSQLWKLGGDVRIGQAHLISGKLSNLGNKIAKKIQPKNSEEATRDFIEQARESAISNASATTADITIAAKDFSLDDVIYHDLMTHLRSYNHQTNFEIQKGTGDNQPLSGSLAVTHQGDSYHFALQANPIIVPSQLIFETVGAPVMLSGSSQLVGNLEGNGRDLNGILATLSGKLGASSVNSSLKRKALVDLAGPLKAIFKLASEDIPLRCAAASASFNNGRGDISAFGFEANHLSLTGNGWVSPIEQKMDLRLNPQMSYAGEMINSPLEISGHFGELQSVALHANTGDLGIQLGGGSGNDNCKSLLATARMGIAGPEPKEADGGSKGEKVAGGILRILGL